MIGTRIKQFRIDNNYSQRDLAQILGVNTRTIARWEQNNNKPNSSEITKLAELIGITEEALLAEDIDSHSEVTPITILDKISDSVDNLVTGQDTLNETLSLTRTENTQRQDEIIVSLKAQNQELLTKLDEQYELISSYKEALDINSSKLRHLRIRTGIVMATCLVVLALVFGTWLYWRNYGVKDEVLVGVPSEYTLSYGD